MSIALPPTALRGEWEVTVFNNQAVVPGVSGGPTVVSDIYELNFAKSGKGMALWVEYSPSTPGNTLTVGALWSTRDGTHFFPSLNGPSVVLTESSVIQICCPGTPDFEITLVSTGTETDAEPDSVTAILCGTSGCCGGGGC